jgi:peptidoglycan/xylan/chitin deacetylase (PgdA/CDA1 family)
MKKNPNILQHFIPFIGVACILLSILLVRLVRARTGFLDNFPKTGITQNRVIRKATFPFMSPVPVKTDTPILTGSPTITPSPTPKPLTFAQMNAQYGPCASVPTIFYHHVQNMTTAKLEGHASLTVDVRIFQQQMQYLKDHEYTPILPDQLIAFFDKGTPLPSKPVLITFDDGYDDFGTDAAPILRSFNFPAVVFTPTGLVQNPGYITWQTISSIASGGRIYFANHTWSHHDVSTTLATDQREIGTADSQLSAHNLNSDKVFAYPYGNPSLNGESVLTSLGYKLGFTTNPGFTQCKGKRLILPRTRIGNANLNRYYL